VLGQKTGDPDKVVVPSRLVVRESCGPVGG
jgi:hypothetical protein